MTDLPTFVNEPIGELRRATVRDELLEGMATLERELPPEASPCGSATAQRRRTS